MALLNRYTGFKSEVSPAPCAWPAILAVPGLMLDIVKGGPTRDDVGQRRKKILDQVGCWNQIMIEVIFLPGKLSQKISKRTARSWLGLFVDGIHTLLGLVVYPNIH